MSKESIIETLEKVNDVLRADLSIEHKKVRDTMTVRDRFAAAALMGLVDIHEHGLSKTVTLAYTYADAMMEAREGK